jgi:hypothetical protein
MTQVSNIDAMINYINPILKNSKCNTDKPSNLNKPKCNNMTEIVTYLF